MASSWLENNNASSWRGNAGWSSTPVLGFRFHYIVRKFRRRVANNTIPEWYRRGRYFHRISIIAYIGDCYLQQSKLINNTEMSQRCFSLKSTKAKTRFCCKANCIIWFCEFRTIWYVCFLGVSENCRKYRWKSSKLLPSTYPQQIFSLYCTGMARCSYVTHGIFVLLISIFSVLLKAPSYLQLLIWKKLMYRESLAFWRCTVSKLSIKTIGFNLSKS